MLDALPAFILASALLSLAPGPDNIFVLTQSALYGRQAGLSITLGLCTGLIGHTVLVVAGVAALLAVSPVAFTILKLAGAAYLVYLAILAWRAGNTRIDAGVRSTTPSLPALYRRGILMNLSNPKVAIFFLAFLPQFADPTAGNMSLQLGLLGLCFILVAWVVFSLIAVLAGTISTLLQNSDRALPLLHKLASLVFVGLALRLAISSR